MASLLPVVYAERGSGESSEADVRCEPAADSDRHDLVAMPSGICYLPGWKKLFFNCLLFVAGNR
jgi:hypothetical protein